MMLAAGTVILCRLAPGQYASPSPHATAQGLPGNSMYVTGKVVLDDGNPAPGSVSIERLCNGTIIREAYTDARGRFSFEAGRTAPAMQDTSANSISDAPAGPLGTAGLVMSSNSGLNGVDGGFGRLADCELRAVLPGFRSDVITLYGRRFDNSPDVGTIVLHRLANVEGTVISKTSLEAPPEARKAYEKGLAELRKNKPAKAQPLLEQAVAIYPKYAAAWYELGGVHMRAGDLAQAEKCFERSKSADPKFISPYLAETELAVREQNWQQTADFSSQLIALDPSDYPQAYYYNALGNLHLQKLDEAGRSAMEARKLDTAHAFPKIYHVLGVIRAEQHDYSGAAAALRAYLRLAPDDHDTATARTQLAGMEKITGPALGVTAHVSPLPDGLRAAIHIDSDHITLVERNEKWTGQLLLAIGFDDSQKPQTKALPIQLRFTPEVLERVKRAGLTLNQTVHIPAGASFMRVDVRDVPSGAMGTFTVELASAKPR